ncbi:MAG: hypothetical protein U0V72_00255 [Cytophagales bacterium]
MKIHLYYRKTIHFFLSFFLIIICSEIKAQENKAPKHFLSLGGNLSIEPLTFLDKDRMMSLYGLNAESKIGRLYLNGNLNYHLPYFTDIQIISEQTSLSYKIGYMYKNTNAESSFGGIAVGYNQNSWIASAPQDESIDAYFATDANGKKYTADVVGVNYKAPYYSLSLLFITMNRTRYSLTEATMDEDDEKRYSKRKRANLLSGALEVGYAPTVSYEKALKYSPWGYYVPKEITMTAPYIQRHWAVNIKMKYTVGIGLGFIAEMGLYPGIVSPYADLKANLVTRLGLMYNFVKAK